MVLALIGTGNMGSALIRGFLKANLLSGSSIRLYDIDQNKAAKLADLTGATVCSTAHEAASGGRHRSDGCQTAIFC